MKYLILAIVLASVLALVWLSTRERFTGGCPKVSSESRQLWYDHVLLTRAYLVKYLDNQPGVEDAANTLMKNQEDLGTFIDRFAPGTKDIATKLLKEHIAGAVDILKDSKEGRDIKVDVAGWYDNANIIAKTLAPALGLSEDTLREMMHTHLKGTLDEATYHLKGDKGQECVAYQGVVDHIMGMSDYLTSTVPCRCDDQ
jgi:hypothetical protein